jgi:hypothetical protein
MKIALDYDQTYTVDPSFWEDFMTLARVRGHEVVCVIKRGPTNQGTNLKMNCPVIYTDRAAKQLFCEQTGVRIDVWIDDSPINLFQAG